MWPARQHLASRVQAVAALALGLCCSIAGADSGHAPGARAAQMDRAAAEFQAGRTEAAAQIYARLAASGEPLAMYNLAVLHLQRKVRGANIATAQRWLEAAAQRDFVDAQVLLAQLYDSGQLGKANPAAALRWYLRAAESGNVDAQLAAGTAYFLGRGTLRDYTAAAHWYRQAANAGDEGAQYLIAAMYEHGDGVARDLRLARYWYRAAARQGDVAAAAKLDALGPDDSDAAPAAATAPP